jgi:hypothetical protein
VALPLEQKDYEKDFESQQSRVEFQKLVSWHPLSNGYLRQIAEPRPMLKLDSTWSTTVTSSLPSGTANRLPEEVGLEQSSNMLASSGSPCFGFTLKNLGGITERYTSDFKRASQPDRQCSILHDIG